MNTAANPATPEPPGIDGVRLDAELGTGRLDPDQSEGEPGLVADYTVTNTGDSRVLVVTERSHIQGGGAIGPDAPEAVWVTASEDGRIRLSKEVFGSDLDFAVAPGSPGVSLGAGESVSGRAFAALPLVYTAPDPSRFHVPGPSSLPAGAREWQFCVQVAPDPRSDRSDSSEVYVDYQVADSTLLCSEPAPLPEGALDR